MQSEEADDSPSLLDGPGLVWIDVPHWDASHRGVLGKRLGLHPRAVHDCAVRNPVPKVHVYPDQVFVVLHAPERGARGHVHYIELDQFIGPNWLLTVHGPMNPVVAARRRLRRDRRGRPQAGDGRLRPTAALRAVRGAGDRADRPAARLPDRR